MIRDDEPPSKRRKTTDNEVDALTSSQDASVASHSQKGVHHSVSLVDVVMIFTLLVSFSSLAPAGGHYSY